MQAEQAERAGLTVLSLIWVMDRLMSMREGLTKLEADCQ